MENSSTKDATEDNYWEIAPLTDLPPGERLFVEVDGRQIVLFNIAGQVFAIGDVCTHDNGPLGDGEVEANEVICPRHGARFNISTGKAQGLPAVVDIPTYLVRVVNGMIAIGIPKG